MPGCIIVTLYRKCARALVLQTLLEHGVAFTVSSDAHFPDDLGKFTSANTELLKSHGVQAVVSFEQRVKNDYIIG